MMDGLSVPFGKNQTEPLFKEVDEE